MHAIKVPLISILQIGPINPSKLIYASKVIVGMDELLTEWSGEK